MADAPLNARTDAILRRLVRKEAGGAVRKVLAKSRPEDIAPAMEHLTADEQRRLFRLIDDRDAAAALLTHLREDSVREITRDLDREQIVDLLQRMEPDDATDVVELLPDHLRQKVVQELRTTEEVELAELLSWPSDTAGGIMSPVVFKMQQTATCGEAIAELQQHSEELENVFYLYVVDERERLTGVISLRSLLVHSPSTPLVSIMSSDVIHVSPHQDQEEVARVVARYDLLGVPVVDPEGRLLGIVTVDDVVDVIREEAAEDMMLMAGVGETDAVIERSAVRLARSRAGWLVATIAGGIAAAELVTAFEDTLKAVALLAGFMPVVMGMGGNVGIQSATVTVRGLATGHVQLGGALAFIYRESRVGLLLGLLFGVLLGGYGLLRYSDDPVIGISVGLAVIVAVTLASVLGSSVPVLLARLGVDPAVATGPFVTTAVDLLGIVTYFSIARVLLGL